MKRTLFFLVVVTLSLLLTVGETWARGGRGGGGARGGGGMSRGGGGGMSRGGGGAARTPSMSRSGARPSTPSRPSGGAAARPAPSRPSTGGAVTRPAPSRPGGSPATRPGTGGAQRPGTGTRPDIGQRPGTGDKRPGTGTRPDIGQRPGTGGGNLADRRPGGGERPSKGDLQSFLDLPGDKTNVGDRANIGDRTNISDRTKVGNRVGDTTINIGSGNKVNRQNNVNSIRNKWNRADNRPFNRNWWNRHPHTGAGWRWHGRWNRYPAGWCWRPATWAAFGGWFAWTWPKPYTYDYENTVVYRDNYVYVDGDQVASADQYYDQAVSIAESVPQDLDADQVEWMPLGVFAIVEESANDTGMLIQLAVSKEGVVAGTFYNETTDVSRPVEGMVNQKTQRVAWGVADGSNPDLVMETGIYNLTEDETTALVHFGKEQTQTWLMIRLPEPEGEQ